MESITLQKLIIFVAGLILVSTDIFLIRCRKPHGISVVVLTILALIFIFFNFYLWINHIGFPLNLDLMEGVVWQHAQRAASFQYIYPQPTPDYVPLAYNPLYYLLSVPFSWIFGMNLPTLRLVAILGMAGCGWILYLVVSRETKSRWWGLMAVGFFAAAYQVMDAYLDTAHSNSWLLFSALWGSYLIYLNRSRTYNMLGVILLVAAFWFKQHGALFAIGGLVFLTWREGVKNSLIYWIVAIILGPLAYIYGGPWLFGPYFHYFTWEIPRNWSEVNFATFKRYIAFILKFYSVLAVSSGIWVLWLVIKERVRLNIWHFQLLIAVLTGLMGSLDPGSSNNVYISMGMWFILCGTIALHEGVERIRSLKQYRIDALAMYVILTFLLFNPFSMVVSSRAGEKFNEMIAMLRSLDGPVYAPSLGQLDRDYMFFPAAHWVALEDMIRGPGRDTYNHPNTRHILDPAINPNGPAYILANYPLDTYSWIAFLGDYYVLEKDFEDRFEPLRVLPKRWDHGWPRYLYRYAPNEINP